MVEMRGIRTQTCGIMQYESKSTSTAGYGKFPLRVNVQSPIPDFHHKQKRHHLVPFLLMVEVRRIELLSENPSTQPSSWTVCYLEFPSGSANRHAIPSGSPFLHDRLKCERPMHVHHSNDAQSEAVVLIGGTGDPQVTALPSLRRSAKIRQP